ncbi:MAG: outer membrane beta-barrel protein [Edaphobacter sp.]
MIYLRSAALLVLAFALPWALHAQAVSMAGASENISRFEFGANYNYFHANAPPGQCGCFSLNGGSGTVIYNITSNWAAVADLTVGHATNVDNSLQNITIFNYLFGPRYTRRMRSRFVPYGQILLGGAKEDVNFQFTINRQSFGLLAGGGVTTPLKGRFGMTLGEVDWIHTRIPNAVNDSQNDIRVVTGITFNLSHE